MYTQTNLKGKKQNLTQTIYAPYNTSWTAAKHTQIRAGPTRRHTLIHTHTHIHAQTFTHIHIFIRRGPSKDDMRPLEHLGGPEDSDLHHGEKRKRISSTSSKPSKDGSNQPMPAVEISASTCAKWDASSKAYRDDRCDHVYIASCVKAEVDDEKPRAEQHTQTYEQTEITANIKRRAGVQATERLKKILPKLKQSLPEDGRKSLLTSMRSYIAGKLTPGTCLSACPSVSDFTYIVRLSLSVYALAWEMSVILICMPLSFCIFTPSRRVK